MGEWLDQMILKVFPTFNVSMILFLLLKQLEKGKKTKQPDSKARIGLCILDLSSKYVELN